MNSDIVFSRDFLTELSEIMSNSFGHALANVDMSFVMVCDVFLRVQHCLHLVINLDMMFLDFSDKVQKIKGKNKQRVIDIDIIDFHGDILTNKIFLPHPRMHLRKFVLLPLYELDKHWCHPLIKKNCIFLISKIKGHQLVKKSKMFS